MPVPPIHLAVALDGAGWHPAAWREPAARPQDLLTAGYWLDLVPDLRYVFDLGIATRSDTLQYLKSCREASEAEALGARTKVPITGDE